MAIKINGVTVLYLGSDDEPVFENITDASGTYDNMRAFIPTIGQINGPANDTLDFNFSSCYDPISTNTTYTEANKAAGRTLLFWLDTTTGVTPTFSSNIKWPNDTEPTWSNNRWWLIGLVCWDNTTVRATASGYN